MNFTLSLLFTFIFFRLEDKIFINPIMKESNNIWNNQLNVHITPLNVLLSEDIYYSIKNETTMYKWLISQKKIYDSPVISFDPFINSGFANTGTIIYKSGVGNVGLSNNKPYSFEKKYNITKFILLHEIGHILGAKHDLNSTTIMSPNGALSNNYTYSNYSRNQINLKLIEYINKYNEILYCNNI